MNADDSPMTKKPVSRLARFAPGLPALLGYRRADFSHDLIAGLSVAAVALPVGVAYAELAGFSPIVGLYSTILPMIAYALFGTSRQLIVGPDAATCALVATAVAPLAAGDPELYMSLSVLNRRPRRDLLHRCQFSATRRSCRLSSRSRFWSVFSTGSRCISWWASSASCSGLPSRPRGIIPHLVELLAENRSDPPADTGGGAGHLRCPADLSQTLSPPAGSAGRRWSPPG